MQPFSMFKYYVYACWLPHTQSHSKFCECINIYSGWKCQKQSGRRSSPAVNEFHSLVPLNKSNIMDDTIIFHLTTDFSPDVSKAIVFFRLRFAAISFVFFRISFCVPRSNSIRGVCPRSLCLPPPARFRMLPAPRRWHTFCDCLCDSDFAGRCLLSLIEGVSFV